MSIKNRGQTTTFMGHKQNLGEESVESEVGMVHKKTKIWDRRVFESELEWSIKKRK